MTAFRTSSACCLNPACDRRSGSSPRSRKRLFASRFVNNLLQMDPKGFEDLVGRLLEEMNYEKVDVIGQSGDGGVDVVADIQLGVTSVREVVQAKRHKRTIQRKDLDALRGSLYRFDAVQGTIVATSRFAKGAVKAAFVPGQAPITLIDGDRLIDLLIEHGIGVRRRGVEVLAFDPGGLS
ncbi:MAG: restriction endonuclease, partial [Gemmatimonadetes bacterium]|nr:restriction endonuclease [Gemmatimonadota bacterium]